jgi:hypothetical protein
MVGRGTSNWGLNRAHWPRWPRIGIGATDYNTVAELANDIKCAELAHREGSKTQ